MTAERFYIGKGARGAKGEFQALSSSCQRDVPDIS